jgi:hypothetical protein
MPRNTLYVDGEEKRHPNQLKNQEKMSPYLKLALKRKMSITKQQSRIFGNNYALGNDVEPSATSRTPKDIKNITSSSDGEDSSEKN